MEKIEATSLNIEHENIKKIKELFPEAVEEGKIDFDMLRTLLGDKIDESKEKYQFTWNGKSKAIKLAQTSSTSTLRPEKNKSKDWDTTENLYIEGDNLEVLKQLQKTYYGKIKMIYIDPPYNTGSDFIYPDNYKLGIENYKEQTLQTSSSNPETSGRYHTDWLNMLYPRLLVAKNLLNENGVLFISIDDNEVTNLKKICDEIFGEENFVAQIVVVVKTEGRRYGGVAKTHEYVLVYAKNIDKLTLNEIEVEGKKYAFFDEGGGFNIQDLRNQNARAFNAKNRPNLRYPFYVDESKIDTNGFLSVSLEKKEGLTEVYPISVNGNDSVWRWGRNEKASRQLNDLVGRKGSDGIIRIYQKMRKLTEMPKTVFSNKEVLSIKGTREIQNLLGLGIFDFPKPIKLIEELMLIGSDNNDIVLDFFSGAATTAHSVMALNAEDAGNRKFILVQLPEKCDEKSEAYKAGYMNICEIGEERIRRAGEQIKQDWGKSHESEGLFASDEQFSTDIGFKVFKLDSTNINEWDSSLKLEEKELAERMGEVFKHDRTKEDVLYEIMLKYGIFDQHVEEISVKEKTMYRVGDEEFMIVCLEDNITSDDVKEIGKLSPKTVVFKEDGFKDDNAKINAQYNLEKAGVEDVKCI